MIFTSTDLFYLLKLLISTCHSKGCTSEAISCPGLLLTSPLQFPGVTSFSRKFKRKKSAANWEQFKKQRNLVTALQRKFMKSYFTQASAECAHPGEFWKKFKPLLPSKTTQQQHIQLLEEGRSITNNMEIANIFNKHFIDGVAAHIPILCEHAFANYLSVNKINLRYNLLQFFFRHVEMGYVKKLIVSLNPKTTGPD